MTPPPRGRHLAAQTLLDRWNRGERSLDSATDHDFRQIADAHRLAWETFAIALAALEDRKNERTPFTARRLSDFMGGSLHSEGHKPSPRNTQFELYVAAALRLPGASVFDGEPDLRFLYGTEEVGVAIKRIRSLNVDQVQKNARDAAKQIERQKIRGWIALNIDRRFESVGYSTDETHRLESFAAAFDSVRSALRRPAAKEHVLGFILFGYASSWDRLPSGMPRFNWAPPTRWEALVDNEQQADFFSQFFHALHDRWERRIDQIFRPDFKQL